AVVYCTFVSLDLVILVPFYELAVLPMYLLIGIWGSTAEVRPRGIFAWAYRATGVGTKEYAAMKLTLYLLFGSAFILVGILALYVNAGAASFSFLDFEAPPSPARSRAGYSSRSPLDSASSPGSGRSPPGPT